MKIIFNKRKFDNNFQIVERKGTGHPDTLADNLAELLSAKYSNYTKENYGAVLHHNFDKLSLLGGASHVFFGGGYITQPIRVLLNGRVSDKFGDDVIPVYELLENWIRDFLSEKLSLDRLKDIVIHNNISTQSSPGKTAEKSEEEGTRHYWFQPRDLDDLQELKKLVSNDTSLGVGFAPTSNLEKFTIDLEYDLSMGEFKLDNPWIGSDIKLMAIKNDNEYSLTVCIPQIAKYVPDVENYKKNIEKVHKYIQEYALRYGINTIEIQSNTRDNFKTNELYLTVTGSSIESGDEGVVGRGNRINQIITPTRPMSMEGASGKNPVYHIGKIYYIAAYQLASMIHEKFNIQNEVYLVSQSGRLLVDPWVAIVSVPEDFSKSEALKDFINKEITFIPNITDELLRMDYLIS
jgi:S-adenosylmethionine synthetase